MNDPLDPITQEILKARSESLAGDKAIIDIIGKVNELVKLVNLRVDLLREEVTFLKARLKERE